MNFRLFLKAGFGLVFVATLFFSFQQSSFAICSPEEPACNDSVSVEIKRQEMENTVSSKNCGFSNIPACIDSFFAWFIKNTLVQFAGFFLWAAAQLLDYIIRVGILEFASWAQGLFPLWKIVNQTISLFVVFSGLYLGFMYIINKGDQFRRYIPWVIIFGLFVNFSYPLTRAAIDVSNVISLNIYASAIDATPAQIAQSSNTAGSIIVKSLGLQGLVVSATSIDEAGQSAGSTDVLKGVNTVPASLLLVGYVGYAAYIFFIAAGILMLRTLALCFVVIASPLLLVDAVIPRLGELAQKLRKILFEQLAVSVVFMFMLYLTVRMTSVFAETGRISSVGGITGTSSIAQIFNVIMMLIVLHIMLKVTKEVSGSVGQMASSAVGKFGGFVTGAALGVATGGAGLLARGTIGAAASRWAGSEALGNAQGKAGMSGWAARRAMDFSKGLANSTFDARQTKTMSSLAGMGGLGGGLKATGRLDTYRKAKDARESDVMLRASLIKDPTLKKQYLEEQAKTNFMQKPQQAFLNTFGPKGSKNDGTETKEKIEKTEARKDEKDLYAYGSADKEAREEMFKRATETQKKIYAAIDEYQSLQEDTSEAITKKKDILLSLNERGVENDVLYNLVKNDFSNLLKKEDNKARNDLIREELNKELAEKNKYKLETEVEGTSRVASANQTDNSIPYTPVSRTGGPMSLETEQQVASRVGEKPTGPIDFGGPDLQEMLKARNPKKPNPAPNSTQTTTKEAEAVV